MNRNPTATHPLGIPSDPAPADRRRTVPLRTRVVTAVAAVAVGLGGGAALVSCATGDTAAGPAYEKLSYAGENPFMDPVGTDRPDVTPVPGAVGEQAGDTEGLYAADPDKPACDAKALVGNLRKEPDKAKAWAEVLGLDVADIPAFVESLSPVVLRADTAVTNHTYRDGTFVPAPAVLAPGTAVFVNSYGEPTVKCYSGNPLTRPQDAAAAGATATVVAPTRVAITSHTFTNPADGRPVVVPGRPDTIGHGPNPAPAPLTGTFNYDGTVTLSDGRIMNPNGTFKQVTPVKHPPGSKIRPDGTVVRPDGKIFNRDGTERKPITLEDGTVIKPDGTVVDKDGKPIPLPPGVTIRHNYDGSVVVAATGANGEDVVTVVDRDGKVGKPVTGKLNTDGSVTTKDGKILNPTGSERTKTPLPDGGAVEPDGTNIPATPKHGKDAEQGQKAGLQADEKAGEDLNRVDGGEAGPLGTPEDQTPTGEPGEQQGPVDEQAGNQGGSAGTDGTDGSATEPGTASGGTAPAEGAAEQVDGR